MGWRGYIYKIKCEFLLPIIELIKLESYKFPIRPTFFLARVLDKNQTTKFYENILQILLKFTSIWLNILSNEARKRGSNVFFSLYSMFYQVLNFPSAFFPFPSRMIWFYYEIICLIKKEQQWKKKKTFLENLKTKHFWNLILCKIKFTIDII